MLLNLSKFFFLWCLLFSYLCASHVSDDLISCDEGQFLCPEGDPDQTHCEAGLCYACPPGTFQISDDFTGPACFATQSPSLYPSSSPSAVPSISTQPSSQPTSSMRWEVLYVLMLLVFHPSDATCSYAGPTRSFSQHFSSLQYCLSLSHLRLNTDGRLHQAYSQQRCRLTRRLKVERWFESISYALLNLICTSQFISIYAILPCWLCCICGL